MIYFIDNGRSFDDYLLVQCQSALPLEDVKALMRVCEPEWSIDFWVPEYFYEGPNGDIISTLARERPDDLLEKLWQHPHIVDASDLRDDLKRSWARAQNFMWEEADKKKLVEMKAKYE